MKEKFHISYGAIYLFTYKNFLVLLRLLYDNKIQCLGPQNIEQPTK